MVQGAVDLLGVAVFAALTVLWPMYYYRGMLSSGIVFTPMVANFVIFLLQVAPSMLLAHYYEFHPTTYPSIVFFLAFVVLWIGFLGVGQTTFLMPKSARSIYFRFLQQQSSLSESAARFVVLVVLTLLALRFFGGLPPTLYSLVATLQGDIGALTKELQASRLDLTKGAYFGGEQRGQGLQTAIQEVGWSLLIAHAAACLAFRGGWRAALWLMAMVVGAWLFVAGTGTRGPFILCCVTGLIAYSLVKPVPMRTALIFFVLVLVVLIFLTSYTHRFQDIVSGDAGWGDAFQRVFDRLIYGNGRNDVRAIWAKDEGLFYEGLGHFHIRNFISAIPGVQGGLPLAYRLTEIFGGGSTTFQTATYISTVYVDFWLPGIVVVFFLLGAVLRLMQNSMIPPSPHPWSVAIVATVTLLSTKLITGGPHAVLSYLAVLLLLIMVHVGVMLLLRILPRVQVSNRRPALSQSGSDRGTF